MQALEKELGKAARFIAKYQESTKIPTKNPLRADIIRHVLLEEHDAVQALCEEVARMEDGNKFLMRALNNCMPIANRFALQFAERLLASASDLEVSFVAHKITQLVESLTSDLTSMGWLHARATQALKDLRKETSKTAQEAYQRLLHAMIAAELRTDANPEHLISAIAPLRPAVLPKSQAIDLKLQFRDTKEEWDKRGAALYLLSYNQELRAHEMEDFLNEAYVHFPLEGLQGVEALSVAVELDIANQLCEDEDEDGERA